MVYGKYNGDDGDHVHCGTLQKVQGFEVFWFFPDLRSLVVPLWPEFVLGSRNDGVNGGNRREAHAQALPCNRVDEILRFAVP